MSTKSKDQTMYNFMQSLQREYIVAQLRSKTYPKPKDKKYHKKVMQFKKEKIQDIALRNGLPTIFSSKQEYERFYREIVPEWGPPAIAYRDDQEKDEFFKWDIINYFARGSEIKLKEEQGAIAVAEIINNNDLFKTVSAGDRLSPNKITVVIKKRGESETEAKLLSHIARIL